MKNKTVILGINVGRNADNGQAHDGGACLLVNNVIQGAISEERLTREKYCGGFEQAACLLLKQAGLSFSDIDIVAVSTYGCEASLDNIGNLGFLDSCRIELVPSHHLSHACSAFYPSGFDESLILVADNEGNIIGPQLYDDMWKNPMERLSVYYGKGKEIELLERDMDGEDEVSLGELYGNMTRFIGFNSYLNAGKTMALASFGNASRFNNVKLIELLDNGKIHCPMQNNYLHSSEEIIRYFAMFGYELPGERKPNDKLDDSLWFDLAAAVQNQLEEALLHKVKYWVNKTGCRSLCLAGGVALNCVANRRLLDEVPLDRIYIQPNCGDQGQGLGNVLYTWYNVLGKQDNVVIPGAGVYLGGKYTVEECIFALEDKRDLLRYHFSDDVADEVAQILAAGSIVGWFQGRSEWGPRALGNRSILADPRDEKMRDYINEAVKHRESFRPFAPVVPIEESYRFFDLSIPCPSMTIVANANEFAKRTIPAVVHVDGTARIQTVSSQDNLLLHSLLYKFEKYSGIPVLINTSFNDVEPIVESPFDAVNTFLKTKMDVLVLGNIVVTKK